MDREFSWIEGFGRDVVLMNRVVWSEKVVGGGGDS